MARTNSNKRAVEGVNTDVAGGVASDRNMSALYAVEPVPVNKTEHWNEFAMLQLLRKLTGDQRFDLYCRAEALVLGRIAKSDYRAPEDGRQWPLGRDWNGQDFSARQR